MKRASTLGLLVAMGAALAGLSSGLLAEDTPKATAVGAETCATCHDEAAAAFRSGQHGQAMQAHQPGILDKACETCHGPGSLHVDDPSTKNIRRIPPDEACLSCHTQQSGYMALTTPGHLRNGIKCLDCHVSGHAAPAAKPLLAARPYDLCARCHAYEANQFKLSFSHRRGSRPFDCTDCHTVHGANRTGRLIQSGDAGACAKCHTEKAGPYVYPHPPRSVNGCMDCHQPHGSVNPKLLARTRVMDLCLECHTNVPSFHDVTRGRYQNCTTCHVGVHGSNHDARLMDE